MFDFSATSDNMILAGGVEAFTASGGVPNGAQFLYGTAYLNENTHGIVTSCNVKTVADRADVKGMGGCRLAHALIDPGLTATVSVVFAKECGLPIRGQILTLDIPSTTPGSADVSTYFWVMDFSVKWEREGFRMLDLELERRDAMFAGNAWYARYVEQDGTLGAAITDLD